MTSGVNGRRHLLERFVEIVEAEQAHPQVAVGRAVVDAPDL